MLRPVLESSPDVHLWSDESGSWGCGAVWQSLWFEVAWNLLPIASASIAPNKFFSDCSCRSDMGTAVKRGYGLRPL